MKNVLITHQVADFKKWKKAFDDHESLRQMNGLSVRDVFRDSQDPGKITILLSAKDFEAAKSFAESDELKEAMENAGVISKPEIQLLNTV